MNQETWCPSCGSNDKDVRKTVLLHTVSTGFGDVEEVRGDCPNGWHSTPQPPAPEPCPVCGNEERNQVDLLTCECPDPSTLASRQKIAEEMRAAAPKQPVSAALEPQIRGCLNCGHDYDLSIQGAICPHETEERRRDSIPPWPKPTALPDSLTKLGNYLAAHDRDIDACWTAKVIEEVRHEIAALRQKIEDLDNGRGNFDELERKNYLLNKREKEIAALKEEIIRYGDHAPSCRECGSAKPCTEHPCDCGWEELRSRIAELEKEKMRRL